MKIRAPEEYPREQYYVSYNFPSTNFLATLSLTYIKDLSEEQIIKDMEREFFIFAKKYPMPLMVSAFDVKGDLIRLRTKGSWPHLCGYPKQNEEIVYSWVKFNGSDIPAVYKTEDYKDKVYKNVSYVTSEELKDEAIKERRIQVLFIRSFVCLFTIIIPLAWLIGGVFYNTIAFLTTLWAFGVLLIKVLRFLGIIKKTEAEKKKEEKELRIAHHDYHCCKNPEGFARLRNENWDKENKEKNLNEYQKIKEKQDDTNPE